MSNPTPKPKQTTAIDHGVGSRIAFLRAANGLSQSALASALGVSFQQVQKYETGKNRVGAGRLQAIAERLGVPVSSFFEPSRKRRARTARPCSGSPGPWNCCGPTIRSATTRCAAMSSRW